MQPLAAFFPIPPCRHSSRPPMVQVRLAPITPRSCFCNSFMLVPRLRQRIDGVFTDASSQLRSAFDSEERRLYLYGYLKLAGASTGARSKTISLMPIPADSARKPATATRTSAIADF
jgi:hypothetical protein